MSTGSQVLIVVSMLDIVTKIASMVTELLGLRVMASLLMERRVVQARYRVSSLTSTQDLDNRPARYDLYVGLRSASFY